MSPLKSRVVSERPPPASLFPHPSQRGSICTGSHSSSLTVRSPCTWNPEPRIKLVSATDIYRRMNGHGHVSHACSKMKLSAARRKVLLVL